MNLKGIQELLKQINKLELAEFKMKTAELELSVRTKHYEKSRPSIVQAAPAPIQAPVVPAAPVVASAPAAPAAPQAEATATPAATPAETSGNLLEIKSPIVGTFYRSSSPEKPPFLKVGDTVKAGDVVCIVEAMKLFNEIESEVSGKVVKVLIEDAQPVEYDQVLFLVDPKG